MFFLGAQIEERVGTSSRESTDFDQPTQHKREYFCP